MDLDDVETISFDALGGADTITVNDVTGTDVSNVNINLAGAGGGDGDGQVDTIIINATNDDDVVLVTGDAGTVSILGLATAVTITGMEATDQIIINGLAGDDVIEASGLAAAVGSLTVNGGAGADVLIGSALQVVPSLTPFTRCGNEVPAHNLKVVGSNPTPATIKNVPPSPEEAAVVFGGRKR